MRRIILFFILCLPAFAKCLGQDPTFSQFYANSLYLAPSFAGATEDYRFSLNYRNQWPFAGVYNTYSVSFDKALPNFNSGIGVLATYDVAGSGDLSTTNVGLVYSYDFNINNEWHVRPGVNFKFYYLGLDIAKLVFNSQITGSGVTPSVTPPPFDNIADIDFAASAMIYNDRIWGGITLDHLLSPKVSFYGDEDESIVYKKFNLFGGMQILRNTRLRQQLYEVMSVAVNFQKQANHYQTDMGLYYFKSPLIFGIWYRGIPFMTSQVGDAVIGLIGIKTDQLHIGYSYDFTISNLITSTKGAHEISLIFEFNNSSLGNRRRIRAIPCPEF
ncbi:MAG: PorP/SprF family type IX secretion system membrane protein [Bacteroidales bacterium]|nr:PorP/SprF family type IX secretion system membrane protein [Bacteroidales bacterium]